MILVSFSRFDRTRGAKLPNISHQLDHCRGQLISATDYKNNWLLNVTPLPLSSWAPDRNCDRYKTDELYKSGAMYQIHAMFFVISSSCLHDMYVK